MRLGMTIRLSSIARAAALGVALLLLAAGTPAEVTRFDVTYREPYGTFAGKPYVRMYAWVKGTLGMDEPIPDLVKADADGDGRVAYGTQAILFVPADLKQGNGTLLLDLANRGRPIAHALYNVPRGFPPEGQAPLPADPQQPPVTTGFLEEQGFLIVAPIWEMGHGVELPTFQDPGGKRRFVEGVGFAAARDIVVFLRDAPGGGAPRANPLAGAVRRTLAVGYSQTGRFLKSFLLHGFNVVEGRRVLDGMHLHTPHAGLLPILQSGAGPLSMANGTPSFADPELPGVHEPPFTYQEIVAAAQRRGEPLPRIIVTNAANDYHALRASLARTGAEDTADAPIPENVRIYDIAGGSHVLWAERPGCGDPRGRLDWHPLLRALLLHLERWVREGTPPPPSRLMPLLPRPGDPQVLGAPPLAPRATIQVPRKDADGNDQGGVALPDLAVPLGTHLDINTPLDDFLCTISGAYRPFAGTREQRERAGDARPSLQERYGDRNGYLERVRQATQRLVREGFLLDRDARAIVESAALVPEFR
jgi:hypothetical protein